MEQEIHNLISLDEVKHFLRTTSNVDDQLIKTLLETALFHLEAYISRAVIQKTYEQVLTQSREVLKHSPVLKVESVRNEAGKELSYNLENNIIEVEGNDKPITVTYKSGLFSGAIPSEFKVALMEIVSLLYNSGSSEESLNSILSKFSSIRNFKL
jgi:uncharacterized phiE125 gp8 family phage protein